MALQAPTGQLCYGPLCMTVDIVIRVAVNRDARNDVLFTGIRCYTLEAFV